MRLMIHQKALARNAEAIAAHGGRLTLLVVDDAGVIRVNGAEVSIDDAQPHAAWANSDVFFSGAARAFMTATLKSQALTWVQSGAAGFDNPVFSQFVDKGAVLTTSHGQAIGIADYVLWGVLDVLQGGAARRADQAARQWTRRPFREIAGSRWVILGFGAIGQGVAERARAFGADITAVRRNPDPHPLADRMVSPSEFADAVAGADVVVLCAPATSETRHIANAALFARMKPDAVFVNVGRGALVDEPALLAALDRGAPCHAVLDVFETEPLPAESPFWAHPSVTLTPHTSGVSTGNAPRNDALFLENLALWIDGRPLRNAADPRDVKAG